MNREQGSTLVWLAIAIIICVSSYRLSLGNFRNPGPGLFPFMAGSIMGVACLVYLREGRRTAPGKERKPIWGEGSRVLKMGIAVFVLLAYTVGMHYLGFLISTILFLTILLRTIETQRWRVVMLESLLASGISYLVFQVWLKAELPRGIFQI